MQLGFVSAILPDLTLEEVLTFASEEKFRCVEVMCWPKGKAERRYAGVTHIDVVGFDADAAKRVQDLTAKTGVAISGLGYYPNPLTPDEAEAKVYVDHIKAVIQASKLLGIGVVNTFVGRDWTKSVEDNWPRFLATWKPLIDFADDHGVKVGIENCPMSFSKDEWPGGKNLATTPVIWRRMFNDIPSSNFGLNFDPSHFVWQGMDYVKVLREFKDRLHHMHAKDARLDRDRLNEVGLLAHPNEYHTPKLPGMGDVNWGQFLGALAEVYDGPLAIEVEDRAYEGTLEARKRSLQISRNYLNAFVG
ncbi:sugar phosphate isomerase/epimerase family protein [Bryobacter aggregatus]|uniref:sugar phosphate isomerase/epimerase family protein n=1 Tax=Bryobacter aggregatus TaxID=360054 RepID=UPI0004E2616C